MFKKAIISAALAAAATMTSPSFADDAAAAAQTLTPAEAKTRSLYLAWNDCMDGKAEILSKAASSIIAARSKAGNAATLEEIKKNGASPEDAQKVLEALEVAESTNLGRILFSATNPEGTCFAELKINFQELNSQIKEIMKKYGPEKTQEMFARPEAAPQP